MLSLDALAELGSHCRAATTRKGQILVREGERGDEVFVVARGEVEVVRGDGSAVTPLARLGPGRYFGETAVLHDVPRTATVRATTAGEVLVIDGERFRVVVGGREAPAPRQTVG
ncbi:MAG: cyclic nucleotide-binding domain-containing protein [Acidimicrobiales bacterium]